MSFQPSSDRVLRPRLTLNLKYSCSFTRNQSGSKRHLVRSFFSQLHLTFIGLFIIQQVRPSFIYLSTTTWEQKKFAVFLKLTFFIIFCSSFVLLLIIQPINNYLQKNQMSVQNDRQQNGEARLSKYHCHIQCGCLSKSQLKTRPLPQTWSSFGLLVENVWPFQYLNLLYCQFGRFQCI